MARLTREEMARTGEKSFFTASLRVMKANPELADRYRFQPGVKEA